MFDCIMLSCRYTKGTNGGLKEWDATNSTFPDGLVTFAEKTGWTFQMHNRMWANDNIYAKQNGGNCKTTTMMMIRDEVHLC